jgi:hypothetical protein
MAGMCCVDQLNLPPKVASNFETTNDRNGAIAELGEKLTSGSYVL